VGHDVRAALEKGLRESDVFAVVVNLTESFRPDVWFECGAAASMCERVVPILPTDV
jgi:hypothetical protein